jgi:predicted AlkP superfamily phosphohydrolase/phosphomutase
LPTDLEGCIRINVKGREPHGVVDPGAQYDELCLELQARLEELVNRSTGAPAVRRVWLRNQVFPGPRQEELPDLVVTWNDEAPLVALQSPRVGVVEGVNPDPRTGTHSPHGFALADGPGIPKAREGRGHLCDLAPTVLELVGLRPVGLDGKCLEALTTPPTQAFVTG